MARSLVVSVAFFFAAAAAAAEEKALYSPQSPNVTVVKVLRTEELGGELLGSSSCDLSSYSIPSFFLTGKVFSCTVSGWHTTWSHSFTVTNKAWRGNPLLDAIYGVYAADGKDCTTSTSGSGFYYYTSYSTSGTQRSSFSATNAPCNSDICCVIVTCEVRGSVSATLRVLVPPTSLLLLILLSSAPPLLTPSFHQNLALSCDSLSITATWAAPLNLTPIVVPIIVVVVACIIGGAAAAARRRRAMATRSNIDITTTFVMPQQQGSSYEVVQPYQQAPYGAPVYQQQQPFYPQPPQQAPYSGGGSYQQPYSGGPLTYYPPKSV